VIGKFMLLQPRNWAVFQHYKDRCPPWIKLHRDLLNDRVFMRLPIASKALAPLLWLLASETKDGQFDGSLDELVFRLHITPKEYEDGLKPLIDKGFFTIASGVLAECYQVAIPEREGETERETETETKKEKKATYVACPPDVDQQVWDDWVALRKNKKTTISETAIDGARKEAAKIGWSLEQFLIEWCTRGSQGLKADWIKADNNKQTESFFERDQKLKRERMKEFTPHVDGLKKIDPKTGFFIEEVSHVYAITSR
jgi:hypothetical protein